MYNNERHVEIPDTTPAGIAVCSLAAGPFTPVSILVNTSTSNALGKNVVVYGYLWGENKGQADYYVFVRNKVQNIAFKWIDLSKSTARGIKIFGI
jgi:hypothetical protein